MKKWRFFQGLRNEWRWYQFSVSGWHVRQNRTVGRTDVPVGGLTPLARGAG
jgi:hypothetical protein